MSFFSSAELYRTNAEYRAGYDAACRYEELPVGCSVWFCTGYQQAKIDLSKD